jgi:hypothetical protein
VRFTRHAKNRMRFHRVTRLEAARIARWGEPDGFDPRGNPRRIGWVGDRRIRVVIALDEPDVVITLFERT